MKRAIRLKERMPSLRVHKPSETYLKMRPTFELGDFFEYTDVNYILNNEVDLSTENNIILVGGSFVENIYCQQNSRITSVLTKQLAKNNYFMNAINMGVSGATTLNLYNLILNKILPMKPSHLVVFIPTNDGVCLELDGGLWNLSKNYSNLINIENVEKKDISNLQVKIENICKIYTLINQMCLMFNVSLTVAASPIIDGEIEGFYIRDFLSHKRLMNNVNIVFDNVLRHCRSLSVNTIDLREDFSNKYELFFDPVHTNSRGSVKVANKLFESLQPSLARYKRYNDFFSEEELFHVLKLSEETSWSEEITVDYTCLKKITLSFEINCSPEVVNRKNALFCVDFSGKKLTNKETGLTISEKVGNYKYIYTESNCKYYISYDFYIPESVSKFKIGFMLWGKVVDIYISDVKIFIEKIK